MADNTEKQTSSEPAAASDQTVTDALFAEKVATQEKADKARAKAEKKAEPSYWELCQRQRKEDKELHDDRVYAANEAKKAVISAMKTGRSGAKKSAQGKAA